MEKKPQNTQNTPKSATRSTASVEKIWGKMEGEMGGEMWGFRSPTPRGRTESCTLRILTDALTGAHEKTLHVEIYRADALSYSRRLAHSRRA